MLLILCVHSLKKAALRYHGISECSDARLADVYLPKRQCFVFVSAKDGLSALALCAKEAWNISHRALPAVRDAIHSPASHRIGKNLINENLVKDVRRTLKKKRAAKIKVLKSISSDHLPNLSANLAKLTGSRVVDVRGRAFVLLSNENSA